MLVGHREMRPRSFTIVGVLPQRFRFTYPRETEIWAMLPWSEVRPTGELATRSSPDFGLALSLLTLRRS